MRTALLVLCIGTTAHADTLHNVDTMGLDVATVWEPANRDAFGAGPLFRYETFTSQLPDWLGMLTRWGVFVDSADRVFSTAALGLIIRPDNDGLYLTAEAGLTFAPQEMEDSMRLDWTGAAAVGYRAGVWDLRATALRGGLFQDTAWMFSLGRDFIRFDATITRTKL
jgi:hypothetical protein